ncbi:MAG: TraR/DksA family transcriptional regulator [Gammaproteobacteria bacterium]|nr:TraR/DksA family transcriptional regulator [Gammaproteobacteria bacterium]
MTKHDEIKQQLLERRDNLVQRMHRISKKMQRTDGPLSQDFAEQATERENEEVLGALGEAGRLELSKINRTLARIDADDYGLCQECGEEIPDARLKILPYAEHCINCAEKQDS